MSGLEMHGEHGHAADEFGRRVGVAVAVIGVILAMVTISSHRAHTAAVIVRTEANDQWAFYQSKKLRGHLMDVAAGLARALAPDPERVADLVARYQADSQRYATEAEEIFQEAKAKENECEHQERRALGLDVSEGFLELGLVLSSLYFMSKRRFFPVLGCVCAVIGVALGIAGFMGLGIFGSLD